MPSNQPKFLMNMLERLEYNDEVRGKSGNLVIKKEGGLIKVYHFRTLTLVLNLHNREVEYHYGISQTDARYLNCIFYYYELYNKYTARYGSVAGWRVFRGEEEINEKGQVIENANV